MPILPNKPRTMPFDIILPIQALTFVIIWGFIFAMILSDRLAKIRKANDQFPLAGPHFRRKQMDLKNPKQKVLVRLELTSRTSTERSL